jgi:Rrf2 family protein
MILMRESEVGIRAVLYLAVHGGEGGLGLGKIAEAQSLSSGYLAHVFDRMVKAGILAADPDGRYRLARAPERITLRDLVESYSGPLELTRCLVHHGTIHPCNNSDQCELNKWWRGLQGAILRELQTRTLADMMARVPKAVAH